MSIYQVRSHYYYFALERMFSDFPSLKPFERKIKTLNAYVEKRKKNMWLFEYIFQCQIILKRIDSYFISNRISFFHKLFILKVTCVKMTHCKDEKSISMQISISNDCRVCPLLLKIRKFYLFQTWLLISFITSFNYLYHDYNYTTMRNSSQRIQKDIVKR